MPHGPSEAPVHHGRLHLPPANPNPEIGHGHRLRHSPKRNLGRSLVLSLGHGASTDLTLRQRNGQTRDDGRCGPLG